MTIGELLPLLDKLPPNLRVVIPGYEGGLEDFDGARMTLIAMDVNSDPYQGPHSVAHESDATRDKNGQPIRVVTAIILGNERI